MDFWSSALLSELKCAECPDAKLHEEKINYCSNFYFLRSHNKNSLIFSFPVKIKCSILDDFSEGRGGEDGFTAELIEKIKKSIRTTPELYPLAGLATKNPSDYASNLEPVTFCKTSPGAGQRLWKADCNNYCNNDDVCLNLSGAISYPERQTVRDVKETKEIFFALLESVADIVSQFDKKEALRSALLSLDQKIMRENLSRYGLVSFIADGTRPVRSYTKYRGTFRIAGPNPNCNIPYFFPKELMPVEMELMASGGVVSGLGIRKKEIFAVTGSNAEGKSTFLQTVRSGFDDHLRGDGRCFVVTKTNLMSAESAEEDISGSDISLFFKNLPPGISGTPKCVTGRGSGSMGMAAMFSKALLKKSSIIIIDEDKSATNLLIPNCMQSEDVVPLSVICKDNRQKLGDSSVLFAAATMDILVAEADRIMEFKNHQPSGINREEFRLKLKNHLLSVAERL